MKLKIGISSCLLGHAVRFDGGHKNNKLVQGLFSQVADFVTVCPEVSIGLSTPRPTMRLSQESPEAGIRLIVPKTGEDLTDMMVAFAERQVERLKGQGLHGFILKKDSPSCGMERVKVYDSNKVPQRTGQGLFAQELQRQMPLLPVEEEGRLRDPVLQDNFLTRVFAYQRLMNLSDKPLLRLSDLINFHTCEKMLIRTHNFAAARSLGQLLASAQKRPVQEVLSEYSVGFMVALSRPASRSQHFGILQRMSGPVKSRLDDISRQELDGSLMLYKAGHMERSVPMALLRLYAKKLRIQYLSQQSYLHAYPVTIRQMGWV